MLYQNTTTPALVWAFDQRISSNAKLVLIRIAFESGDDDKCLLTELRLAADTSLPPKKVRRAITELEERGLIRSDEISRIETAYYLSLS